MQEQRTACGVSSTPIAEVREAPLERHIDTNISALLQQVEQADIETVVDPNAPITVVAGAYNEQFTNLAGVRIGDVRATLKSAANIDDEASALINGDPVECETQVLQPGQYLEFIKIAGVKG